MDDNQCRVCLGEANDSRLSVFKRVNGVLIEEKLEFVAGVKIKKEDIFSKLLCTKCFNETCVAYDLKKKCLDTERTLKNLELKFQTKLNEKVQEIIGQTQNDSQNDEILKANAQLENDEIEFVNTEEDEAAEPGTAEPENFIMYCEAAEDVAEESAPADIYEEVEYLETNEMQQEEQDQELEVELEVEWSEIVPVKKLTQFLCTLCEPNLTFKTEIGLERHQWSVHQIKDRDPLVCLVCNYTFDGNDKEDRLARIMEKHMTGHENGKQKSCMMCPEVFKSLRHLEEHQYRHHYNPSSQNKCKGCQNDFLTYEALKAHLMTTDCKDTHEKPFKCYICCETFSLGIAKKKHIQMMHQDRAGADCPLCVRCTIPSAVAFENHYKTHFAQPRFCCSFCGRPFFESDRLQTHIRRAHENTKFSCNWCSKTFRDKSGIARHILGVHFNQRDHRCHLCSKAFTASYNLKEHMFSVHKQANKLYNCETCSQDFLYRKPYERHRTRCSGVPEKRRR